MSSSLLSPEVLQSLARENKAPGMVAGIIVTMVISSVVLALRLFTHRLTKRKWWWDDYTIVIGWVFGMATALCGCLAFRYGAGRHVVTIRTSYEDPLYHFEIILKFGYWMSILWGISVCFIKISLLLFYRQIFALGLQRSKRIGFNIVFAFLVIVGIYSLINTIFHCWPIQYLWKISYLYVGQKVPISGTCPGFTIRGTVSSALNIASDLLVLVIPMVAVPKLQISWKKRAGLGGVFFLGALCIVVSAVRISYMVASPLGADLTWDDANVVFLTCIEPQGGVICASLPLLVPLFKMRRLQTARQTSSMRYKSPTATGGWSSTRLTSGTDRDDLHPAYSSESFPAHSETENSSFPKDSIHIQREFSVELTPPMTHDVTQLTNSTYQYSTR